MTKSIYKKEMFINMYVYVILWLFVCMFCTSNTGSLCDYISSYILVIPICHTKKALI